MPNKKTYLVDGNPVEVEEKDAPAFLKNYPNAKEAMTFIMETGDTVDVEIKDVEAFQKSYPKAKSAYEQEPVKKKEQSDPYSFQTFGQSLGTKKTATPSPLLPSDSTSKSGVGKPNLFKGVGDKMPTETSPVIEETKQIAKIQEGIVNRPEQNKEIIENIKAGNTDDDYVKRLGDRAIRGINTLNKGLAQAPEMVYNLFAIPQNIIAEQVEGAEWLSTSSENVKADLGIDNEVAQYYDEQIKQLAYLDNKYMGANGSIVNLIKEGNYLDAAKLVGEQIAESLPTTAAIAASGGLGASPSAITLIGGVVFGAAKQEELQGRTDLSDAEKAAISFSTGMLEGLIENIGTANLGRIAKEIIAKEGVESGKEVVKKTFVDAYKEAMKKFAPISGAIHEGLEEGGTQFSENIIDIVTGVAPNKKLTDGVLDATIVGTGSGAVISSPMLLSKVRNEKVAKTTEEIGQIDVELKNPNISPNAAQKLIQVRQSKMEEINNEIEADVEIQKQLPEETKREVESINEQLLTIDTDIESATTEVGKAALEESKAELEARLDEIVSDPLIAELEKLKVTEAKDEKTETEKTETTILDSETAQTADSGTPATATTEAGSVGVGGDVEEKVSGLQHTKSQLEEIAKEEGIDNAIASFKKDLDVKENRLAELTKYEKGKLPSQKTKSKEIQSLEKRIEEVRKDVENLEKIKSEQSLKETPKAETKELAPQEKGEKINERKEKNQDQDQVLGQPMDSAAGKKGATNLGTKGVPVAKSKNDSQKNKENTNKSQETKDEVGEIKSEIKRLKAEMAKAPTRSKKGVLSKAFYKALIREQNTLLRKAQGLPPRKYNVGNLDPVGRASKKLKDFERELSMSAGQSIENLTDPTELFIHNIIGSIKPIGLDVTNDQLELLRKEGVTSKDGLTLDKLIIDQFGGTDIDQLSVRVDVLDFLASFNTIDGYIDGLRDMYIPKDPRQGAQDYEALNEIKDFDGFESMEEREMALDEAEVAFELIEETLDQMTDEQIQAMHDAFLEQDIETINQLYNEQQDNDNRTETGATENISQEKESGRDSGEAENTETRPTKEQLEADLKDAEKALASAENDLTKARKNYEKALSESQIDLMGNAKQDVLLFKADLPALNKRVKEFEAKRDEAKALLEKAQTALDNFVPDNQVQMDLPSKIRDLKIDGKNKLYDATIGIPVALYNTGVEMVAKAVEGGIALRKAIESAVKYIDEQMKGKQWNRGMFYKDMNIRYSVTLPNGKKVEVEKDTTKETAEVINGWYSPIEQKLLDTKVDKTTGKEWIKKLGGGEEMQWTGLENFLNENANTSLTKSEIQQYLKDNRVSVVEVVKGGVKSKGMTAKEAIKKLEQGYDVYYMPNDGSSEFQVYEIEDTDSQTREYFLDGDFEGAGDPTKFSQYQLEGEKENYSEKLVILPNKKVNISEFVDKNTDYIIEAYKKSGKLVVEC